ncbi:tetratricopeptide repeat protein [Candidatus Riflebacteria bacterium]
MKKNFILPMAFVLLLFFVFCPVLFAKGSKISNFDAFVQKTASRYATSMNALRLLAPLKTLNREKLKTAADNQKWGEDSNSLFLRLACYYLGRDYSRAMDLIKKKKKFKDNDLLLLVAKVAGKSKKYLGRAIGYFRKVLKRDKKNINAMVGLGEVYVLKNFLMLAKKQFDKALQADDGNLDALLGLSEYHFRNGEVQKALATASRAKTLHPENPAPYSKYADLLYHTTGISQMQTVIENYRFATIMAPKDAEYLVKITVAMLRMNYDFTAIEYVKRARRVAPQHPSVLWMTGLFAEIRGDLKKAVEYYEAAIAKDSSQPDYHYCLANLYAAKPNVDFIPQARNVRMRFYYRIQSSSNALAEYDTVLALDKGYRYRNKVVARIRKVNQHIANVQKSIKVPTEEELMNEQTMNNFMDGF